MLNHPTHDQLITLGLPGMAKAFEEQRLSPDLSALSLRNASPLWSTGKPPIEIISVS